MKSDIPGAGAFQAKIWRRAPDMRGRTSVAIEPPMMTLRHLHPPTDGKSRGLHKQTHGYLKMKNYCPWNGLDSQ